MTQSVAPGAIFPRSRLVVVVVVLAAFVISVVFVRGGRRISNGPNIVVILTDDQSPDTLPHDPPAMPYLQRRIDDPSDRWIKFPNAFINTPLCCPSRATILSGLYSHETGVLRNEDGHLFQDASTVASWLNGVGYWTGLVGKYLNRYPFDREPFIPPGWDEWAAKMHGDVTSVYFDYRLFENGQVVHYGVEPKDYMPDVLTTKAVDFIRNAPEGRPFFLYFAPTAPHAPWVPAPRHEGAFSKLRIDKQPNYNEEDVTDKPAWVQALNEVKKRKERILDFQHRNELEALLGVDDSIRAIFEALEQRNSLDDTVVFFLTDNGYSFGEHRLIGKRCAYDECAKTPFYVRYPDVVSREDRTVISNADLAPTIAGLAETAPSTRVDGLDLSRVLAGNRRIHRPGVLIEWAGDQDVPPYNALRTQEFLYVEYPTTGERELYDLRGAVGHSDPYGLKNVAGEREFRGIERRLESQLAATLAR